MALSTGIRMGPYEVLGPLGAGGMGEVYKARDTRLDRTVAIKVLPEHIAKREDLRARFEREARAVASLNHPNICTLYDIGNQDGVAYIVLEHLEGETLAARIKKGALPLDQALPFAIQIADALDRAHRAGVTHRDVKPQNLMLTRDGVKVLDFGLAKSTVKGAPSDETLTDVLTTEGTVLGTPQYMAPEQFECKEADARSDIWAFGAVLYEMVTGQKAFSGKSYSSLVGAILSSDPPPMPAKPVTPAWLERLVRRCLAKDPEDRWQSIRDVAIDLRTPPQESAAARPAKAVFWPWLAAGVLAVVAAAASWIAFRATRPAEFKPLVRLDVDLGPEVSLSRVGGARVILSPDGTRLVYVSQGKLFTRKLDQPNAIELPGTEGASAPFFAPDGRWVAFFATGKLKKISVEGGSAIALCDTAVGAGGLLGGGSWGVDANIIAALNTSAPLSRIPSAGGEPAPLTELGPGEATHRWPQILPGGKAVLFTAHSGVINGFDDATIEVMSLADRRRKTLVRGGTFGRYSPSGHLLYVNKGTLFAVPFDLNTLAVHGAPSPLLDRVAYSSGNGLAQFDFSRTGTLIYESGVSRRPVFTVQWMDPAGKTQPLLAKADSYVSPRLSPDGTRLALTAEDVWIYDWQRDIMTRLSYGGGAYAPVWSRDGRYIVYWASQGMFWTRSDGAGKPELLIQGKQPQLPYAFMPDDKRLVFHVVPAGSGGLQVWTVPLESSSTGLRAGKPEPFLQTQFNERDPSFSPDGRWLAYNSDQSGSYQVYVQAFPDKSGKVQISNGSGIYPVFSRNGRELFFRTLDNRIMVAAYTAKSDSFVAEKPRVWSEKRIGDTGLNGANFDVAPDGKRIVALMPLETPTAPQVQNHVVFLMNFFDELRRKVPADK